MEVGGMHMHRSSSLVTGQEADLTLNLVIFPVQFIRCSSMNRKKSLYLNFATPAVYLLDTTEASCHNHGPLCSFHVGDDLGHSGEDTNRRLCSKMH